MNYGYGLKVIREAMGLDTIDFADKCNVTPGTIFKIEENCEEYNREELLEILNRFEIEEDLYTILCVERKDVVEERRFAYDVTVEHVHNVLKLLIIDPAHNDEPIKNKKEISDAIVKLYDSMDRIT